MEKTDDMDEIGMTGARAWIPRSAAQRVAQRLRDRRRSLGLTQVELAAGVGVAHPTYVHWEKGRLPDTIDAGTVKALEAVLQLPQGWLLRQDAPSLPDPVAIAGDVPACTPAGSVTLPVRIPVARCEQIGPRAAQLRKALGFSVAEVARGCGVSSVTLSQWERGAFPKALTGQQLRAWERALRLAPGQLLESPEGAANASNHG
ncbi:helix-turn-helix domain-containing protein [Paraburkholderia silviterrae]|uniref:Helix-turn-helix domain-containing protein n=1 Tax=Paraburkholderia silviterrae TaxID=2528715 RepID=A0A4R5M8M1_9BURK|nr:helix-turn-helix domain-containing protein [Paraburkholderia silviterrae]TDG22738.1 helix-turn-helix domain-containing protein [Paraburkholderia silviterrae]